MTAEVDALFEDYEFGKLCEALYHFAWDEVCDWYLELAKSALPGPSGQTTRDVLGYVLDALLRLLHPVIPFVTEELWTALTGGDSVMTAPWPGQRPGQPGRPGALRSSATPRPGGGGRDRLGDAAGDRGPPVPLGPGAAARASRFPPRSPGSSAGALAGHEESIRALLRLSAPGVRRSAPTASLVAEGVTVELDTAGVIDVAAERRRVEKDLAAARAEAEQAQRKLGNESFLAKAPGRRRGEDPVPAGGRAGRHRPATGRLAALPGMTLERNARQLAEDRAGDPTPAAPSTRSCRRWTGSPRWPPCSGTRSGPAR